jgi:hypothetical protein
MVEAGESEYSVVLKTRKLLILRDAKNAENGKIAANWNVSGTLTFQPARRFREEDSFSGHYYVSLLSDLGRFAPALPGPTGIANSLRHSGSPTRRRSSAKRGSERRLSRRASVVR